MFDVGFAELFVLAIIGLLVLGPERLPGVARTVGGFVRKARASWISLRNTIQSELDAADISAPIKQATEEFKQIGKNLADISSGEPEEAESVFQEPKSDAPKDQEPAPLEGTGPEKDQDV